MFNNGVLTSPSFDGRLNRRFNNHHLPRIGTAGPPLETQKYNHVINKRMPVILNLNSYQSCPKPTKE